ncbi:MAG: hypothetical protein HQM12_18720 [SAR324 cluster bacterium]|nr:hypothetical protein [SAR324 cluster bacterium]
MELPETVTLDEFKLLPIDEIFVSISTLRRSVSVKLPDGQEVLIQAKAQLKPLPVLQGYIPKGWKEGIYDES